MNLERILYCRGYCFLDSSISFEFPTYFNKYRLDENYSFYSDDSNQISVMHINNDWIVLCGLIIDTYDSSLDINSIANNIYQYLSISENYFLEYLDSLSGRFILAYKYNNKCYFYNDACGMKSAYYFLKNKKIISSHQNLVKNISGITELSFVTQVPKEEKIPFSYGYPGRTTTIKDIYQLTPNTRINLNNSSIERFFPREDLEKTNCFSSVEMFVKRNFQNQISYLKRTKLKPVISLTAGYDSRFTLASLKEELKNFIFFTYKSHEAHNIDLLMGKDISERLELCHRILLIKDEDKNDKLFSQFCNIMAKNSFYVHNYIVAYKYLLSFLGLSSFQSQFIHIRSNLAEIGRLFYGLHSREEIFTSVDMIKLWKRYKSDTNNIEEIKYAFDDFYITTNFGHLYNYNPNDIFYWEHRMGTWLSQVLVESDPAFDTLILFNNRKVLKALLSVPTEARKNNTIFYNIINNFLPELKDYPINPNSWPLP